jgi:hypothetical protein
MPHAYLTPDLTHLLQTMNGKFDAATSTAILNGKVPQSR